MLLPIGILTKRERRSNRAIKQFQASEIAGPSGVDIFEAPIKSQFGLHSMRHMELGKNALSKVLVPATWPESPLVAEAVE